MGFRQRKNRKSTGKTCSQVDLVSLDIGYGLIPLVNTETGGQLLTRVKGVRKKLSTELGFLVQPVRIRDNLDLEPNTYHLMVNGVIRGRGESHAGKELAINPGHVSTPLEGIATKEPAFGLEACGLNHRSVIMQERSAIPSWMRQRRSRLI